MAKKKTIQHNLLMSRFIELANELKESGIPVEDINTGLMAASCTYATYVAAGNDGYLNTLRVKEIAEAYRRNLQAVQDFKAKQSEATEGS